MEDRACSTSDRAAPRSYAPVTVSTETAATTADLPIWQLMAADWQVLTMGPDTYGALVTAGDTVTSTAAFTVGEHGPETVTLPVGAVVWPTVDVRPDPLLHAHDFGGPYPDCAECVRKALATMQKLKGARPAEDPRVSVIPGDDGMSHVMVSGPALPAETVGSPDRC